MACYLGMCSDWESNRWPFGSKAHTQSTELPQPGCGVRYTLILMTSVILGHRHKHRQRRWSEETQGEGGHLQTKERSLGQIFPSQASEGMSPANAACPELGKGAGQSMDAAVPGPGVEMWVRWFCLAMGNPWEGLAAGKTQPVINPAVLGDTSFSPGGGSQLCHTASMAYILIPPKTFWQQYIIYLVPSVFSACAQP